MVKLPAISGNDIINALKKDGFEIVRQKGSHVSLQKGKYRTVVPMHRELAKGTIIGILKQCGLSQNDLLNLLKK